MSSDDLLKMSDLVEDGDYTERVQAACQTAITREIDDIGGIVSNFTSESELDDHASVLRRLAPRAGIPEHFLRHALETIDERIEEVKIAQAKAHEPDLPDGKAGLDDTFGDDALYSLFDSLR